MQGQHSSICPTPRNAAYADSLAPRSGIAASPADPTTATATGAPDYPSPPTGGEAAPSLCCACTAAPAQVRAGQRWRRQAPTHCLLEPSSETAEQRSGIADCSGHRCCRPHTRHGHTAHDRRHALSHLPQERPRSATEAVEAVGATRAYCALAARLAAAVAAAAAASSDFAGFDADAALLRGAAVLGAAATVCCFFSSRSRSRRCWG